MVKGCGIAAVALWIITAVCAVAALAAQTPWAVERTVGANIGAGLVGLVSFGTCVLALITSAVYLTMKLWRR
ncbi:MAG: hypothetical protein Q4A31_04540 [Corynebacterium sp.]|uniref:hypothetical protein n=1 Tax=Corynebacterium sp. TaxID=1720 RepID=UPI0026DAB042|nr:hypothetical protein [Corynebacterium sp.]MDO4761164.1 hypothetical protein [Corynebacterium sp.]